MSGVGSTEPPDEREAAASPPPGAGERGVPARVLVLGLERSGRAASLLLRAQGTEVVAHDDATAIDVAAIEAAGARILLGDHGLAPLEGVELVVKSPGVPAEAPLVTGARVRGIPVVAEVELAARLLANPLLGITGTNGKTTTTALLGAVFAAAGVPAEVAGNIGRPLAGLVGAIDENAWIVCELSSFQLEGVDTLRPRVAVLLNLEPDHLDRHRTLEAYRSAKLRMFARQGEGDTAIVPRGFGPVPGGGRRVEFAADDVLPAEPLLRGAHNRENAAAATAAARAAGLPDHAIATALSSFRGVAHRIEEIAESGGVRYINDSKATNVAAARRALASFPDARLHVILGGLGKHESYEPLAAAFKRGDRAYLIGTAAAELAAALGAARVPFVACGDLATALTRANAAALLGDVVLLSPACASFDQFESYEHRGEEFGRLVQKLIA